MRGLFVTATDTDAGKTILCACLLAAMAAAGEDVRAHKPAASAVDEPAGDWPQDHELLGWLAGVDPDAVAPLRYGPAVSPHLAAELAGEPIDPAGLIDRARAAGAAVAGEPVAGERVAGGREPVAGEPILIVEGAGGLLVPFSDGFSVRDLARALGLPVLIAARPGLGTINHTLLTLEAARAAGLDVRAVVLTPWPENPSRLELSNRETIERLGGVEVGVLARVPAPGMLAGEVPGENTRAELALAGAALAWERWVA